MGYMRHGAVLVVANGYAFMSGISDPGYKTPDVESFRESLPEHWRPLLIGPVTSITNDYRLWAFLPDGSKEGWRDSDDGDVYRREFADLFSFKYEDGSSPFDVLIVSFGGDHRHRVTTEIG